MQRYSCLQRILICALSCGSLRRMDCPRTIMFPIFSESMSSVCLCSRICPQRYQSPSFRHNTGLHDGTLYQMSLRGRLKLLIPCYRLRGSLVEQWQKSKLAWAVVNINFGFRVLVYKVLYMCRKIIHTHNQMLF